MMKIAKDFKNGLLNRREMNVLVEEESNPGFDKARKSLSEEFKVPEEQIVINAIRSNFGANSFLLDAFLYASVEDRNRVERKKKNKKKEGK